MGQGVVFLDAEEEMLVARLMELKHITSKSELLTVLLKSVLPQALEEEEQLQGLGQRGNEWDIKNLQ